MAPCAYSALQSSENFERPSHLPNYCILITTRYFLQYCIRILRIIPLTFPIIRDKFVSYPESLDPTGSLSAGHCPGGREPTSEGGDVLQTLSFFQKDKSGPGTELRTWLGSSRNGFLFILAMAASNLTLVQSIFFNSL